MCKYKDTNLGIKKLDFGMKRGAMAVYLTDGRVVIVPVSMFLRNNSLSGLPSGDPDNFTPKSPTPSGRWSSSRSG